MEDIKPEEVKEPVALAVEPALEPEMNRALHGSTMEAEAPVVEPEPEVVAVPEPAAAADKNAGLPGAGIFVQLSALVPHSRRKNSRSVTSVQARLIELGYSSAGDDDRGHFADGTIKALEDFVSDKKIKADSLVDESVVKALFKGTAVEVVA